MIIDLHKRYYYQNLITGGHMKLIIKYTTLIRIASLVLFVLIGLIGLMLPIDKFFEFYYVALILIFGLFQVCLTIINNRYKAISNSRFIRNLIIRIVISILLTILAYIIFFAGDLYNNPFVALLFIFLAVLSGFYFDYLDKKNSKVVKK